MDLFFSPASPFARKVMLTAHLKGLADRIRTRPADTGGTGDPALNAANPLGKLPCLIVDGLTLFDSRVICEYLDAVGTGPAVFPATGPERWQTLTLGALGDGIADAALLMVYEKRMRPEDKYVESWVARQRTKIDRSIAVLEAAPPALDRGITYGPLTVAAAPGYLDLRHPGIWRERAPRLVAWLNDFAARVPAFAATRPPT
jgi:glutathione S-transferase